MNQQKICQRCVLPESPPDIYLNEDGLCNVCIDYEKNQKKREMGRLLETDFTKILNKYKGRGGYDCLVMCSGGKDSTSALYYMKRRYKLNPLAFTFDNGFENDEALANIKNAVQILDVDFLFFKSDFMKEMFSKALKRDAKAVICHLCSIWYMQVSFDIAEKYDIPIIIAGWTKGQAARKDTFLEEKSHSEYISMARATEEFLNDFTRRNPKYRDFPRSMEEVLSRAAKRHKCLVLSPHWFLGKGESEYVELIKRELRWKPPALSYPAGSTNCYLNFISVYNSMRHFGYTHYHIEMSKLIREGLISREEALKALEINFDKNFLNSIAGKIDYRVE